MSWEPNGRTVTAPDGRNVARVLTCPADAALMAAAPDLLAALRALLDAIEAVCITHGAVGRLDEHVASARAILARLGEP